MRKGPDGNRGDHGRGMFALPSPLADGGLGQALSPWVCRTSRATRICSLRGALEGDSETSVRSPRWPG